MSGGYVQFGPWTDGGAPGISAEFLGPLETFLLTINSAAYDSHITANGSGIETLLGIVLNGALQANPAAVPVTGTTAGSASLYQFLTGTIKAFVLYFNGYRNSTATEQTISLPTPFTTAALWWAGSSKSVRPYASGSALTNKVNIITALSSGSGAGSPTPENATQGYSNGDIVAAFDSVGLGTSEASTSTGLVFFIGI